MNGNVYGLAANIFFSFHYSLDDDGNLLKVRTVSALAIDEWKQQILCKVNTKYEQFLRSVPECSSTSTYNDYLNGVFTFNLYVCVLNILQLRLPLTAIPDYINNFPISSLWYSVISIHHFLFSRAILIQTCFESFTFRATRVLCDCGNFGVFCRIPCFFRVACHALILRCVERLAKVPRSVELQILKLHVT